MLVLSRKQDQEIVFPNLGITISLVQVSAQRARVGITAPPDVAILRGELAKEMCIGAAKEMGAISSAGSYAGASAESESQADRSSFSAVDARLQRRLLVAASALTEMQELCSGELSEEAQDCMRRAFHELNAIDSEAARIHDRPKQLGSHRHTALLVDDNANEANLLASFLKFRNFDVAIAEDGRAALQYLDENRQPDVVLLDMVMPGLDGPATIRSIRQSSTHHSLRVFGVSGGAPEDYGISLDQGDVDGWFQKPVDPEDMIFKLKFEDESLQNQNTVAAAGEGLLS